MRWRKRLLELDEERVRNVRDMLSAEAGPEAALLWMEKAAITKRTG
jgi:hypothetical protein